MHSGAKRRAVDQHSADAVRLLYLPRGLCRRSAGLDQCFQGSHLRAAPEVGERHLYGRRHGSHSLNRNQRNRAILSLHWRQHTVRRREAQPADRQDVTQLESASVLCWCSIPQHTKQASVPFLSHTFKHPSFPFFFLFSCSLFFFFFFLSFPSLSFFSFSFFLILLFLPVSFSSSITPSPSIFQNPTQPRLGID